MLIESVKVLKKKKCQYVVTVDGQEYVLTEDVLVKFRLKKNDEIDAPTLATVLDENEKYLCLDALLACASFKTEKGYREKLYAKGFASAAVNFALDYARKHGYADDERFAQSYYEKYAAKKSAALIRHELKNKGVSGEILASLPRGDERDTVLEIAKKYMKNKEKTPENKIRLQRHLVSKGFSYGDVAYAARRLFDDED